MARFGQQVVKGLINPSFRQGLFDVGTAIGSAPRRAREEQERKAKEEQLKSILQMGTAAATTGDPTNLSRVAQRLSQIPGMEQQAMEAAKLAREASETMQKKETTAKTGRGKGELMALANNPQFNIMDQKQQAGYLGLADSYGVSREEAMEIAMQSKKSPEERFKVVGNNIYDLFEQRFIEPSEASPEELKIGDLQKIATPASILKYLESGDKSDLEAITKEKPDDNNLVPQLLATDTVLETVDKAMGLTDDYWVVGYDLAKLAPLPTDAKQMDGYVKTLQANLAFDRLQKMRDASKTGGALGQVSNIELDLLKSSVAALDPGSKNFKEQLAVVRRQYQNFRNALLGLEPNDTTKYVKLDGKLYYKLGEDFIDLEEAAKKGTYNLSPDPKTGGEF